MNILAKKCSKIPGFSLAWDLKNISEFWRKNELKSLNLALGFKKYVWILAKSLDLALGFKKIWILAKKWIKKVLKIPRLSKKNELSIGEYLR